MNDQIKSYVTQIIAMVTSFVSMAAAMHWITPNSVDAVNQALITAGGGLTALIVAFFTIRANFHNNQAKTDDKLQATALIHSATANGNPQLAASIADHFKMNDIQIDPPK
jgi:hypothetical protein